MKGYERSPDMTMRLGSDFVDFLIRNPQARLGQSIVNLLWELFIVQSAHQTFDQFLFNIHDEEILRLLNERT